MGKPAAWVNRGAYYGLLSAALFGASTPAAKILLGSALPQLIAGLLYLGSGIGLTIVQVARVRRVQSEAPVRRADALWLVGATLAGGIVGPVLLVNGLAHTSAASASLMLNLEGVATAVIAWVVFREHTSRRMVVGMMAILLGAAVLTWNGTTFGHSFEGLPLVAAACICWAIDNNLTRHISASNPFTIATVKSVAAGSVNVGIGLFVLHDRLPDVRVVAIIALVGFVGYGLSLVCFIFGLRYAGTARTGAYFASAPFIGAVVSIAVLRSGVDWRFAVAGILMAAGVYLHLTETHEHEHGHEALEHDHAHVHDEHHQHEHSPDDADGPEPHTHAHTHTPLVHSHPHFPDIHHRHEH